MNAGFWILAALILVAIVICFAKGKVALGLVGFLTLFPQTFFIFMWFPVIGALRYAKVDSPWARSRYGPEEMAKAAAQAKALRPATGRRAQTEGPPPPPPAGQWSAPPPDPGPPRAETHPDRTAILAFLRKARDEGAIDPATFERLLTILDRPAPAKAPAPPAAEPAGPAAPPADLPEPKPEEPPAVAPPPPPPPTPVPPAPSQPAPRRRRRRRVRNRFPVLNLRFCRQGRERRARWRLPPRSCGEPSPPTSPSTAWPIWASY